MFKQIDQYKVSVRQALDDGFTRFSVPELLAPVLPGSRSPPPSTQRVPHPPSTAPGRRPQRLEARVVKEPDESGIPTTAPTGASSRRWMLTAARRWSAGRWLGTARHWTGAERGRRPRAGQGAPTCAYSGGGGHGRGLPSLPTGVPCSSQRPPAPAPAVVARRMSSSAATPQAAAA
ncbi:hypothetical protein SETIT_1G205500v2 [Setaria italica]|uniref:Uncharacterized protein n=1 Tax=Setaria italica TaxID=4555 RepID=A0A368PNF1_SETIT|nr:hypothetical protein SETIT_1G205500v2 [Setaria italica]